MTAPKRKTNWAPDSLHDDGEDAFARVFHLVCWQHGANYEKVKAAKGRALEDAGHIVGILADYLADEGHAAAADSLRALRNLYGDERLEGNGPLGGDEPTVADVMRQEVAEMLEMGTEVER